MKKTYINPNIEVVKMNMNQQMLSGSLSKGSNPVSDPGKVLGREDDDFDW